MIIGVGIAEKMLQNYGMDWKSDWIRTNAHFLLGYNEPDYGNGHNHPHMISANQAAIDWVQVQKVADLFDPPLQLVGPAVSSSGPDAWTADGVSEW